MIKMIKLYICTCCAYPTRSGARFLFYYINLSLLPCPKFTYINFSARKQPGHARNNLYIVSLHVLLVWKNHPAVLPTTYIKVCLPGVNDKVYIDWWHAQLQTSKNEIIIKYATFHITEKKFHLILYTFLISHESAYKASIFS